ncbi:hypothetical protein ABZT03_44740 [Streptomyces sp. NPDC005574]|uniref:hypothetical protein n=1 Tax=Streptomyces sp. NPDC005574 TaxID=3156891 RepID=UPI0033B0C704
MAEGLQGLDECLEEDLALLRGVQGGDELVREVPDVTAEIVVLGLLRDGQSFQRICQPIKVVEAIGKPGNPPHPAQIRIGEHSLQMGQAVQFLTVFKVCCLLPMGMFLGQAAVPDRDVQLGRADDLQPGVKAAPLSQGEVGCVLGR